MDFQIADTIERKGTTTIRINREIKEELDNINKSPQIAISIILGKAKALDTIENSIKEVIRAEFNKLNIPELMKAIEYIKDKFSSYSY